MRVKERDLNQNIPCPTTLGNYLWKDFPDEKNGQIVCTAVCA